MRKEIERLGHYLLRAPDKLGSLLRMVYATKLSSAKGFRREGFASSLPPLMTLQINNLCNLRCVQCWEWGDNGAYKEVGHQTLKDEMSTEQWETFIDEVSEWRPYLYFFGGEPLLRRDISKILAFATSRKLLTALNSNTTLMTEELAEGLVRSGLDYYVASLDGPEQVNNKIRKGNDVYNRVISGIKLLVGAKKRLKSALPAVEVCTTVTAENAEHILETAEIVNGLGVDYFALQAGMFTTPELLGRTETRFRETFGMTPRLWRGFLRDTSGIDPQSLANQEKIIRESTRTFKFKRYPKLGVKGFDYDAYFKSPASVFGEKICHVPWKRAVVMPNGDVVGCPLFPEAKMGNVREQKFTEIWNGRGMRTFRRSLSEDGLFPSCGRCCDLYELDES
ncbi:MAG TPA: radical SAM protein [Pyrinomonadaceae bacterium]|jgi:radical SAM protein with 4Fe4S-binding SPASM domain|nr:radical SAM protein [Pyrinomonadaceae bacterium]